MIELKKNILNLLTHNKLDYNNIIKMCYTHIPNKDRTDISENNCQPLSTISHTLKTSDERSNGKHDIFNKLLNNEEERSKLSIHIITELIKGVNHSCPNYKEAIHNAVKGAIS